MRRSASLLALLALPFAFSVAHGDEDEDVGIVGALTGEVGKIKKLELVKKRKLSDLFPGKHFEASGVSVFGNRFYVVFDDRPDAARISTDLESGEILPGKGDRGYEGIAVDRSRSRFLVVVESAKRGGLLYGRVDEYSSTWKRTDHAWLPLEVDEKNKGYEGLELVERDGEMFVLALREAPDADGRGRIDVFKRNSGRVLDRAGTIRLPKGLDFKDYSGLDVRDGKILVVSQESRALWIGVLHPEKWDVVGKGKVLDFPKLDGEKLWANVEGVAWVDSNRIVVVSDERKSGEPGKKGDESIAIFKLEK